MAVMVLAGAEAGGFTGAMLGSVLAVVADCFTEGEESLGFVGFVGVAITGAAGGAMTSANGICQYVRGICDHNRKGETHFINPMKLSLQY